MEFIARVMAGPVASVDGWVLDTDPAAMRRKRVYTLVALLVLGASASWLFGEVLTYVVGRPIRSPYVVPILNLVMIGSVLVIAIAVSGVAIRIVGPRRPSALIIPTIVGLTVLALSFWLIVVVLGRGEVVSPLIAMVVATFVAAFLQRPGFDRS